MNKKDLITNFSQLFSGNDDGEKIPPDKYEYFMEKANVLSVVPKLKHIRTLLESNFDCTTRPFDLKKWNKYKVHHIGNCDMEVFARLDGGKIDDIQENTIKIDTEYLKIILKLVTKTQDDSVLFKVRKDYPLWVETSEMIIIVAPRIEENDI